MEASSSGTFKETAQVNTNDPDWPSVELTVTGRILNVVKTDPYELVFSHVSAPEGATGTIRVFGYREEPLEITDVRVEGGDAPDKVDVTLAPLSDEELAKEQDAQSGYRAEVTLQPGLPPGLFRHTIVFETNVESRPKIPVTLKGRVGGNISIVGQNWSEDRNLLDIGIVKSSEGTERTLLIVARGPHSGGVKYRVVETVPKLLEVDEEALARVTEASGGAVSHATLKIRIPRGTLPANHLGSALGKAGRITLETNHPTIPRLNVHVRFAVLD